MLESVSPIQTMYLVIFSDMAKLYRKKIPQKIIDMQLVWQFYFCKRYLLLYLWCIMFGLIIIFIVNFKETTNKNCLILHAFLWQILFNTLS